MGLKTSCAILFVKIQIREIMFQYFFITTTRSLYMHTIQFFVTLSAGAEK